MNLQNSNGALVATYVYDADGNRVQKTTTTGNYSDPAGTWLFVYDQSGHPIQEFNAPYYTGNGGSIYAGGRFLARVGGWTSFIHSDWLGTKRMSNRFANPTTLNNCSSLPFGDGLTCTGSDDSPIHFTGKERDAATGLDNLGARYNASSMGRFMSPDPSGGHPQDPQTLNRYVYVRNNPVNLTDPTGLDFYLQCTDKDHKGCIQVPISPRKDGTWVQADKGGNAAIITSDSIRAGQNTATVDENGVTINGKSQGIYFDNSASQTKDANGNVVDDRNPITLAGSGALQDFRITINGNCGGTCLSSGTWSFTGSWDDARETLNLRGSFLFPGEDLRAAAGKGDHPYSTQHRFAGANCSNIVYSNSCQNSPHLSVPYDPKRNVPQGFHVDAHGDIYHHNQDVDRKGVQ